MDGTVLVADDDRTIRTVLAQALTRAGCRVHATSSLTTLMRWVGEGMGDAVITDVMMPDGNGLDLLPQIAELRPGLPVIVISAHNTMMTAIQANEADAYDYLPKPFDLPDLMKRTAQALRERRRQVGSAEATEERYPDDLPLVGRTQVMQALYRKVARLMNSDLPILVVGETGVGKSLLARAVHDLSERREKPLLVVTADSVRDPEAPARLLAQAQDGDILLEGICDIPADLQTRIVRMIDGSEGDGARFIATIRKEPVAALEVGELRDDLYYRLAGATIQVPALRDRVDDIPLLADCFLARAKSEGDFRRRLSGEATDLFLHCAWPGNVRQLEMVVRQLAAVCRSEEIPRGEAEAILGNQPRMEPKQAAGDDGKLSKSVARHLRRYFDRHGKHLPPPGLYRRIVREVESPLIGIALAATSGNQAKCATLLGINRNTLHKKIMDLDIRVARGRELK